MSNQKNKLKQLLEAQNADTVELKRQLKSAGIPSSTLWKYINQPETDISGTHIAIILRTIKCNIDDLIVAPATIGTDAEQFNLSN